MDKLLNLEKKHIHLLHALVVGPFLGYIGWCGINGEPIPKEYYNIMLVVGIIAALYHGSKLYEMGEIPLGL